MSVSSNTPPTETRADAVSAPTDSNEPRNIVICFDGTNNEFGDANTNVVRLVQVLESHPSTQLVYYDPGVGTLPEPWISNRIAKQIGKWWSLAFGTGLIPNVEEAYTFLMDFWKPGDRVFVFGFSRGAYTARVLAGMLHSLGLLPRGNANMVRYVTRLFGGLRTQGAAQEKEATNNYWKLCNGFRWTFGRPVDGDDRRFPVHFLGLWDTVSSVGWILEPKTYPYTAQNPSVRHIRHAVSLDERRWFFRQNLMRPDEGQDCQQMWFPGVHADVGGGYAENQGGLWRVSFDWIVREAQLQGLRVDSARLARVLQRVAPPATPWAEPAHESLTSQWWLAEFFPKWVYNRDTRNHRLGIGAGHSRTLLKGDTLHESVLHRLRNASLDYQPSNLSLSFRARVRALPDVPSALTYDP